MNVSKITLKNLVVFFICFSSFHALSAQIRLPQIIRDSMVLQRNHPIKIWGWAAQREKISVTFNGKHRKTVTSRGGNWSVEFPEMKAGGPYSIQLNGPNKIELNDILVGDVWLCAGQSNMVHQLNIHDITYANEIANANYPEIRHFKIPTQTDLTGPNKDFNGGSWQSAVPDEIRSFSAVTYFFAKKIYKKYKVPIGLINASVGGTPIEAWTSEAGFQEFPEILKTIEKNKDTAYVNSRIRGKRGADKMADDIGDKGLMGPLAWYDPNFVPKNWRRINIPGYWEDQGIRNLNGVVWYRKVIEIPTDMIAQEAKVFLGRIVDADELYINGQKVGNTTYQYPQRRYTVPKNIVKAGTNIFTIKVTNYNGKGGFVPDKPYYLFTETDTVDLKGYWQYKVGEIFNPSVPSSTSTRPINAQNEPTALYNVMVAPYTQFSLKGILWYQGESNSGEPKAYEGLLKGLINDWRTQFNQPDIPFIYAQLPNFMEVNYLPEESNWAELRQSQLKSLSLSNTAMTVNIDLGEWNDIHPDNKKDVGERLALSAMKLAYHANVVYSGPLYADYKINEKAIEITFSNLGSGLISNDGKQLSEFAIAGKDKNYVWANAKIVGNKVIVWSDAIQDPKYVRYAWADNPDNPNLYNKEGLPASPFTTE
ncbi:sialate O-acetylesterase [Pricia antarctica]|uniref:Sialate O-acetylesterase n=1 Tax=Pricia antarctica TaxID=641691 RepID=A0A1G7HRQ9_9FLAO|nr:sialate O-acetylesterase [Pricia antarctica]SDF03171.1 sialate O-acetylesterase [Pricia antarctica]